MNSTDPNMNQGELMVILIQAITALVAKFWFLFLSTVAVGIVAAGLIVNLPETFTSSATVVVSETADAKGGALSMLKESGLGSLLGGLGQDKSNLPLLEALLDTRELAFWAVKTYKLDSVWTDGSDKPMRPENQVRFWVGSFAWMSHENGSLELSFRSPTPELSQKVVQGVLYWLDSAFRGVAKQNGAIRESYLDIRLKSQLKIVDSLQDSVAEFQIRNKLISPSDQVETVVRGAGDLEIQAEKLDLEIRSLSPVVGEGNSQIQQMIFARNQMKSAAKRLLDRDVGGSLVKGLSTGLRAGIQLQRMQKQLQIQVLIYSYLLQQKEQSAFDLTKDLPSLTVIDRPILPKKRTSPPRYLLFQSAIVFWLLLSCGWIVVKDVLSRKPPSDAVLAAWNNLLRRFPGFVRRFIS